MASDTLSLQSLEQRLNELEMQAAFQEQLITDLNDALTAESARVNALQEQMTMLRQRLQASAETDAGEPTPEPPPPHY